jgi:N-acetylneuraminate synthase
VANQSVKISDHIVGDTGPVYMMAEIGINHNGSIEIAKRLIDATFACGWHCAKFQKRTPDLCVPENQKSVIRETPWGKITYLEYRHKVEFGKKEYSYIDQYCKEKPVDWSASVWDIPSLEFILTYKVPFIKIPSSKITENELMRLAAQSGTPVVISTGMSTVEEIDTAVEILEKHSKGNYILMHTNSVYPTPPSEANLRVIPFLKQRYQCVIGYSGHENNLEPTIVAVTLGARMVERHITVDHNMWGSDHAASLEVHGMDILYGRIKQVDVILGDGVKRITPNELEVRKKLRGDKPAGK